MVDPVAERRGYETRDLNVRAVIHSAIGLVGALAITLVVVLGLFCVFEHRHPSPEPPSRIAREARMIAPPPQLQTSPSADLIQFQAAEEAKLNSYGWIDKSAGVIRIPIERAMDLVAQRGLPVRGAGTQDASGVTPVQMQERKAATKP